MHTKDRILYVDDASLVAALRSLADNPDIIGANELRLERRPGDEHRFRVTLTEPETETPLRGARKLSREEVLLHEYERVEREYNETIERANRLNARLVEILAESEHVEQAVKRGT